MKVYLIVLILAAGNPEVLKMHEHASWEDCIKAAQSITMVIEPDEKRSLAVAYCASNAPLDTQKVEL